MFLPRARILADERIARSHNPFGRLGTEREESLLGHRSGHTTNRRRRDAIYVGVRLGVTGENARVRFTDRFDKKQLRGVWLGVFGEVFIESWGGVGTRFDAIGRG